MDSSEVGELDSVTRQRLLGWMLARFTLWTVSLGIAIGLDGLGADLSLVARRGLYLTSGAALVWAVFSAAWFSRLGQPQRFAGFQIGSDIAIVTALVYFSGGRESVFSVLYIFIAVYGALFISGLGALRAATLCALAYGGVLWVENLQLTPELGGSPPVAPLMIAAIWGVHVGALFLSGALASVLSRELQKSASDLHRLQDLHECTVDSLLSGLLTTDFEYRILSFNPEAERITGARADAVRGMGLDEVIPGACDLIQSLRAGTDGAASPRRSRLSYRNRAGRELFLGVAGSILRDERSRPIGNVVIFQDVSEIVRMERDLRRSERLAAVGEMAAKMAHEIRNPLAAISGSIQVLERDLKLANAGDEPACLMGVVVRETDRLNALIADFLQYARPRALRPEPVSLPEVVSEQFKLLEALRPDAVTMDCSGVDEAIISADADQFRQVLWNLCLNSFQAMPDGGELVVETELTPAPRVAQDAPSGDRSQSGEAEGRAVRWIEICVRDTGIGIDRDGQERIFEPFYTTKRSGTGLGLATVHRIVEAHGGRLRVVSEAGKGAAVTMSFPQYDTREHTNEV